MIVCELDGHSVGDDSRFKSVKNSCEKIEEYVDKNLNGELCSPYGFSSMHGQKTFTGGAYSLLRTRHDQYSDKDILPHGRKTEIL